MKSSAGILSIKNLNFILASRNSVLHGQPSLKPVEVIQFSTKIPFTCLYFAYFKLRDSLQGPLLSL